MNIDSQILESYVPVYESIPEKWEDAKPLVVEQLKKIALAINSREIGFYLDEELISGKAFIPGTVSGWSGTNQIFRTILRKVIDFGSLPHTASKSVPHGIVADFSFTLIALWACATDPSGLKIPIPYATPVALNQTISLQMDAINFTITTGTNRTNFNRCFIVCEYIQEL